LPAWRRTAFARTARDRLPLQSGAVVGNADMTNFHQWQETIHFSHQADSETLGNQQNKLGEA
jgi:hypothetical protein